jgi:hypothetical protein
MLAASRLSYPKGVESSVEIALGLQPVLLLVQSSRSVANTVLIYCSKDVTSSNVFAVCASLLSMHQEVSNLQAATSQSFDTIIIGLNLVSEAKGINCPHRPVLS